MDNKLKTPIKKQYLIGTLVLFVVAFGFVYFSSVKRRQQTQGQTLGSYDKSVRLSEDNLSLVRKEKNDKIFLNVCNDTYLKFKDRNKYPTLVEVKLALKDPNEIGLPKKKENEKLYAYEDDLRHELLATSDSLFVVTSSGDSHRHFIIYTKNVDAAKKTISAMEETLPEYDLVVADKSDPQWKEYDSLCQDEK